VRLKGAVIVITGASSGIGEAAALAFARKKANLVLGARRVDQLNSVAQQCREKGAPEVTDRVTTNASTCWSTTQAWAGWGASTRCLRKRSRS